MQIKENSKTVIVWEDYYHNITKSKENDIKESYSKKYNIPKSLIEVEKVYLKKNETTERISNAILDSLLNPEKLKESYINYFENNFPEADKTEFLKIDEEITSKLQSIEDAHDLRDRKYEFLWIKAKNIFSYNSFYRNFSDKKGINSIYSNPENQGGKTALSRMPAFLLFGNKIKYGRKTNITFADIFNIYTEENEAFIEGEIKIQSDTYYLSRTLKKSKSGTISHSFKIYKYDDTADFIESIGKNAIDLSIKDAQVTRKKFENIIGTYEDYVFSSYYESQNIEKWLETSETERYRLFCEYLGLGILEEKYQIASKILNVHQKTSLISTYNLETLYEEIKDSEEELESIVSSINEIKEGILKDLENQISLKNKELESLFSKKKSIDSKVENVNEFSLKNEIDTISNQLKNLNEEYLRILSEIESIDDYYKDFKNEKNYTDKIDDLVRKMSSIDSEIPLELKSSLNELKTSLMEVKESDESLEKLNTLLENYQNLQIKYKTEKGFIEALKEEYNNIGDGYVCSKCGNVENPEEKQNAINSKIEAKKLLLKEIEASGISAKKEYESFKNEIQENISKEKRAITEKIRLVENQINDLRNELIQKIQKEITELRKLKENFTNYNNLVNRKEITLKDIEVKNETKVSKDNLLKLYHESRDIINFNKEVDSEIVSKKSEITFLQREIYSENQKIQELTSKEGGIKYKIESHKNIISQMKADYEYEKNLKVYLQVHGDEGLSKHIILSVLPQINTDLAEVLAGITDFDLQIDFNEKGIRFMFERDGKRFNLYQGSGFEKAISCLALHYVNIRMTTLPISNNLVLDEIFGGVSKKNIESIDKILRKLNEVFDTVDIITHTLTDEFKKIVDNAFLIQKENNNSKIIY
jgi:DNA repair exonuclease SbcCD ATPase subunit